MRIIIVIPEQPAHAKYFCAYLGRRHELVRVIHPAAARLGSRAGLRKARRELARSGVTPSLLRVLATLLNPWIGWDCASAVHEAENRIFPSVAAAYKEVVAPVAARVLDVNAEATIELVRDAAADVVLCLGGPIYRAPLINACGTMINFHSGVSPLYNGASAIMFAFANGHFRLCGGTLMTMSPIVDGGDILAHYLPAIEAGDTPATLFMKTVRGAAETADRFLALSASMGWAMERKEELVDTLWKACDMPPLHEFLDEHQPYFTRDGLKRWLAAGHGVGLHTASHPFCSRLSAEGIRAEIEEPAALLRAELGLCFLPFSYPFGIRLAKAAERRLYEDEVFDCAFGIEGFVPRGTPAYRLERACIEGDLAFTVFGTALLGTTRRFLRKGSAAA